MGVINLVANEPCSSTSFPDFKLSDLSNYTGLNGRVGVGFIFNSYLVNIWFWMHAHNPSILIP